MITQTFITPATPMGATLTSGGAIFRTWAPRAQAVYLNGTFSGRTITGQSSGYALVNDGRGYWAGFLAGATEGDLYSFYVLGMGSQGPKRDPYAREMATDAPFPNCSCVIRSATAYPWHDGAFVTPDYSNMIVYQIHVGTYAIQTPGVSASFLDVIGKIPYLAALGVNVLQPLPIDEQESDPPMGYSGSDYFSADLPYIVYSPAALQGYLGTINSLLAAQGYPPLTVADITPAPAQLKCLIDLCHLHGIAVTFDVVYNHAGGFEGDDRSLYFFDRAAPVTDNNQSLYFTAQGYVGGLSFALWNQDVRQFLLNTAAGYIKEYHVDGFRYDEISALLSMNTDNGWKFCANLTDTVRYLEPRALQNAEYWPGEFSASRGSILSSTAAGGTGFDVLQHDALRIAIRDTIAAACGGQAAQLDLDAIAGTLFPPDLAHAWQAVTCVENHDLVNLNTGQRIPALADPLDHRSWYARSRSRVATALLLFAPGLPQLFMGQEILEDKQWNWDPRDTNHLIGWTGLTSGSDRARVDHLRFTQDAIRVRWNQPAIRGENVRAFHVHNQNRVIAFHRWLEITGQDVIVVATLAEQTWYNYDIGFPYPGPWREIFNSDVYDNWVNPVVAGNGGGITANGPPLHGFPASASLVIPANGVVVFARN
jgi:1,4-alpha-glucan branching enzyme